MIYLKRTWQLILRKLKIYSQFQIAKISVGKQSTLSVQTFLFDILCTFTPLLWSERPPISCTCNFYQMHSLIKDNSFQSLLGFRDLIPNSDVVSCYMIKMFPVFFFFHKDLLVKNLHVCKFTSCEFYMSWAFNFDIMNTLH